MNPKKSTYDAPKGFWHAWTCEMKRCPERMENGKCFMADNLSCTEDDPADTCDCPLLEKTNMLCPECFREGHIVYLYKQERTGTMVCIDLNGCNYIATEEEVRRRWLAERADFEANWGYQKEEAVR